MLKPNKEVFALIRLKYSTKEYNRSSLLRLVEDKLADGRPFILEDIDARILTKSEVDKLNTDEDT